MKASGWLHAAVALRPGEDPAVRILYEVR